VIEADGYDWSVKLSILIPLVFTFGIFANADTTDPAREVNELTSSHIVARAKNVVRKDGKILRIHFYDESHLRPSLKQFITELRRVVATKNKNALKALVSPQFDCIAHKEDQVATKGVEKCFPYLNVDSDEFWKRFNYVISQGGCFGQVGNRTALEGEAMDKFILPSIEYCFEQSFIDPEMAGVSSHRSTRPVFFADKIKLYEKPDLKSSFVETQPTKICPTGETSMKCRGWTYYDSNYGVVGFAKEPILKMAGGGTVVVELVNKKWKIVWIEILSDFKI
jgi:hypothetical protein